MKVYFFGCRNGTQSGHYWQGVPRNEVGLLGAPKQLPKYITNQIDSGFLVCGFQGQSSLVHIDDYTIVSWPDYSVDTRSGSNATFVVCAPRLTFEEALKHAREAFPEVFARFGYEIVLK